MENLKVSIITVVFNAEDTIANTIESIVRQDYPNIEYIVVDGGSSDRTVEIIKDNTQYIHAWVSESDDGVYDAMNKGLALASGGIIGILNSDDFYLYSDAISNVVKAFENDPEIDMVLGGVDFVQREDLTKIVRSYSSYKFTPWHLKFGFMPPHPGAFISKSAYEKVGLYKLGYKIGADFDMFVRMLLVHKLSYKKLNRTLVRMRMGGISTSGFESYITSTKEMLRSLKQNQVYSNLIMVLIRLPVKYLQKILSNLTEK